MIHYDIIIIGGGLSGLLQADRISDLENRDLKIAIVDPEPTSLQSKTLSSWRRSAEGLHRYSGLVSHRWQKFRVVHSDGRSVERAFGGYVYETISGSDLFGFLHSKLTKDARFVWRQAKVQAVHEFRQPDSRNRVARVQLSNGEVLHADQVLSSPAIHETPVLQYFLGFEIEATSNVFDPEAVDLMDFRVDQGRDVRFVYILPYSQRRALVEFTVFSESRLSTEECERHLRHYLAVHKNLHSFSILKTESGIIPMSEDCVPLFPPAFQSTCIRGIGGASSRVKPSTGYSFQRNLLDPRERGLRTFLNFRFRIYDSILLEIIRSEGARGADVFFRLFSGNSPEMVFSFLDERTRIREEARIFRALPWGLFYRSVPGSTPTFFVSSPLLDSKK